MNFSKRKACVLFSPKRGQETSSKSLFDRGNSEISPDRIYKNSLQAGKLTWKYETTDSEVFNTLWSKRQTAMPDNL